MFAIQAERFQRGYDDRDRRGSEGVTADETIHPG